MPTTQQTGNLHERMAVKALERQGYGTYRVARSPIKKGDGTWFSPKVDIGGGDIVAWKPGERLRIIQVTADSGVQERVLEFAKACWPVEHVRTELWQWRGTAAGLGITREEWARSQHFRVRWSDDEFALVPERMEWPDGEPPVPSVTQRKLGRAFT